MRYRLWLLERGVAASLVLSLAGCGGEPAPEPVDSQSVIVPEPAGVASTYTDFDLEACEVLSEQREEGSSASYRCPGFGDVRLLVQEGDGRFDVDAGVDDDSFQTIAAFNDLGETVEWRLSGNDPAVVIFRYLDVTMEANGRTVLAVETIGREGAPGCRVAHIAGNTPDANQRARDAADATQADSFVCPEQPDLIGNAG